MKLRRLGGGNEKSLKPSRDPNSSKPDEWNSAKCDFQQETPFSEELRETQQC